MVNSRTGNSKNYCFYYWFGKKTRNQEINIMYVGTTLTVWKRIRTSFSDSPLNFDVSVEEVTLKKVLLHSVATALANNVLPVPGGPTKRTPFHGLRIPCHRSQVRIYLAHYGLLSKKTLYWKGISS